eukprot:5960107-Prymnesium_polylepis.4
MSGGDTTIHKKLTRSDDTDFPQFPGEDFLAHTAEQYREVAEARLATRHLLAVAEGYPPASIKSIIDVDLSKLPSLPADNRDYQCREETRIKIMAQNQANAEKRFTMTMHWSRHYSKELSLRNQPLKTQCWFPPEFLRNWLAGTPSAKTLELQLGGGSEPPSAKYTWVEIGD